jgi:hypothetical protein
MHRASLNAAQRRLLVGVPRSCGENAMIASLDETGVRMPVSGKNTRLSPPGRLANALLQLLIIEAHGARRSCVIPIQRPIRQGPRRKRDQKTVRATSRDETSMSEMSGAL